MTKFVVSILFLFPLDVLADFDLGKQRDCRITRFVSAPYFQNEKPEIGALAHFKNRQTGQYEIISLQNLIDDDFIYFKNPSGIFTQDYLWLYDPPRKIEDASATGAIKFFSASVVGDTIITIDDFSNFGGQVEVTYANTNTGFMFSMSCKP